MNSGKFWCFQRRALQKCIEFCCCTTTSGRLLSSSDPSKGPHILLHLKNHTPQKCDRDAHIFGYTLIGGKVLFTSSEDRSSRNISKSPFVSENNSLRHRCILVFRSYPLLQFQQEIPFFSLATELPYSPVMQHRFGWSVHFARPNPPYSWTNSPLRHLRKTS